jgi:ribosome-associated protein
MLRKSKPLSRRPAKQAVATEILPEEESSKAITQAKFRKLIVEAILDKKGHDVISLDLRKISDAVADFFIIVHGDSRPQVKAIRDSVVEKAFEAGLRPYHTEGERQGEWIIIDFADVVVHVFEKEKRFFYQLEELWHDAKTTKYA